MRKLVPFFVLSSIILQSQTLPPKQKSSRSAAAPARAAALPRHLVSYSGALTEPAAGAPAEIAQTFLQKAAPGMGLSGSDLSGVYVARQYRSENNGVTHILFRQRFLDVDVYGAAYAVNIDSDGRVLNAGGDLYRSPAPTAAPDATSGAQALRAAVRELNPEADGSYLAAPPLPGEKLMRFARGGIGDLTEGKQVWYPVSGNLRSAWLFYIPDQNGRHRFATVVDASSQRLLRKLNLTHRFQQTGTLPPAQGLVFDRESPQPNPTPGVRNENRPYVPRVLKSFTGDPIASPRGWVDGTQTIGNNVVAGTNTTAQGQILNPRPATAPDRNFSFPLELGPGAPPLTNYEDAATTNLFYWANLAHDRFYQFGFNEAAGNFQQDNFGRGGVGGDPMLAYSHFGIAAAGSALIDNSFFTSNRDFEDGSRSSINMYIWTGIDSSVFADGSFDAEVIVHEYTHGVSDRLTERVYDTHQGRSMGEGWSDYFGLELTQPTGIDPDGFYPVGEYAWQNFGIGIRSHPYSTNLSINPLTLATLGRVSLSGPEVHDDGEIWAAALWECRAALIKQLGEVEGRRRMAQLVIDGMKLAPPQPSMIDARDAVLLADRVDFRDASQTQLWTAFAKRGFGVVAHSETADSNAVTPSFATPSNAGTIRFEWDSYSFGEQVRVLLYDANLTANEVTIQLTSSSGDLENLLLRKQGEMFAGTISLSSAGGSDRFDSFLDVIPSDYITAYYVDTDTGAGAKLIETTVPVTPDYSVTLQRAPASVAGTETRLYTAAQGMTVYSTPVAKALPFPFRFFGVEYKLMYVSANGYITFGLPSISDFFFLNELPCGTRDVASQIPTIAPLWTELAYGGTAQANEGVFYSSTPGAVTIRWAAETFATGEPVNFSVVLYDHGRIEFQYGTGVNLVSSALFGCSATTPLIGVSNGHGTFTQTIDELMGLPFVEGLPNVILDPPYNNSSLPVVNIETPVTGGSYAGIVTIKGTAYDPNDAIARLDVLVDGVPRRLIMPTQSRPDVCNADRVPGCPNIGFQVSLDLAAENLAPGTHTIQIQATNTRGAFRRFPDQPITITVGPGQSHVPVAKIETPVDGIVVTGNQPIRGYAYAEDVRIVSVDVIIDGATYGQAIYGQRRDDICSALDPRPLNCPNIGFTFTLNSVSGLLLPNGTHTLQVRTRDESNRLTLLPEVPVSITVDNPSSASPVGVLSNPQPNSVLSGTVKIWGWAWDPDGTVRTAQLVVDGLTFLTLNYGDPRPEQCQALSDVSACPNIGFWGDFDTTLLPDGTHQIGVRLTDNRGNTAVIPRVNYNGEDVVIRNRAQGPTTTSASSGK